MISVVTATFLWIFPTVSLRLGRCFVDFSGYSYFFMNFSGCFAGFGELFCGIQWLQLLFYEFFRLFRWFWGAVLWNSAVTATFLWIFPAVSLWFGELFCGFRRLQLLFFQNFSSFWAGLGSCFRSFMDYSGIKIHSRKNDCEFFYEKNHLIDS